MGVCNGLECLKQIAALWQACFGQALASQVAATCRIEKEQLETHSRCQCAPHLGGGRNFKTFE
eukprot:1837672-Amphidinium_carterae.1